MIVIRDPVVKILVITPETAHLRTDELDEAYRLRHRVFVEERGWEAWRKPDGREVDEFDPNGSISFLVMEGGQVIACLRMVPGGGLNNELATAQKRQLLLDRPHLCGVGRYCVDTSLRGGPRLHGPNTEYLAPQLVIAILEFAQENRIPELFFETDPVFFKLVRVLGIPVEFIGEAMPYYGREMVMGIVAVNEQVLNAARRRLKVADRLLSDR